MVEIAIRFEQRLALVPHRGRVTRIDPESVLKGRERFLDPLLLSEDQAFVVVRAGGLRVVRGYGACAS